jgi:hypothetical protein
MIILTLLILVFLAGVRISYSDWESVIRASRMYRNARKRDPSTYYIPPCTCGKCTPEDREQQQQNAYLRELNNLAKGVSMHFHSGIFSSGITLIALYFIIQLIFKS